jgi:hypothetical protein
MYKGRWVRSPFGMVVNTDLVQSCTYHHCSFFTSSLPHFPQDGALVRGVPCHPLAHRTPIAARPQLPSGDCPQLAMPHRPVADCVGLRTERQRTRRRVPIYGYHAGYAPPQKPWCGCERIGRWRLGIEAGTLREQGLVVRAAAEVEVTQTMGANSRVSLRVRSPRDQLRGGRAPTSALGGRRVLVRAYGSWVGPRIEPYGDGWEAAPMEDAHVPTNGG